MQSVYQKNLDLLEQGPHGIIEYDDDSIIRAHMLKMVWMT